MQMRAISDKITRINTIVNKFENTRQEFVDVENRLVKIIKDIIQKYADNYELSKENSVRTIKFYSVVSRVKESNSLSEKLIRNNDYNMFDQTLEDIENIDQTELKTKIKEIDDIIGIKILTDLNIDTINMYKLVSSSDFINDAKQLGIHFNESDLSSQPVTMKNGLNIYKIRCNFDEWKFELQIKNKLESAWGDMEHSIFYKDYKVTPVRDLAQQSMKHIGKLLIEIDDFLQEIRNANDNFTTNSSIILFINNFEEKFSTVVREKLNGISYNFKKIASLCYNLNQVETTILNNTNINIDYQALENEKYNSYINYRNHDFDLQIFESIILSNINSTINEDNLETNLDRFFDLIMSSYVKMTLDNNLLQDEELSKRLIELIFESCINFGCKEFILNTKNIYNHIDILKTIVEVIEVLELENPKVDEIIQIFTIFCFGGNIVEYCNGIDKDTLIENLEKSKLELEKLSFSKENISLHFNKIISNLN